MSGNALPLLLVHDDIEYGSSAADRSAADDFLSHGLTFLLQARETQPFNRHHIGSDVHYRMPDTPYSLFEGLAGTVAAWAEACVVVLARLREIELKEKNESINNDTEFLDLRSHELGFPGFSTKGFL